MCAMVELGDFANQYLKEISDLSFFSPFYNHCSQSCDRILFVKYIYLVIFFFLFVICST